MESTLIKKSLELWEFMESKVQREKKILVKNQSKEFPELIIINTWGLD